MSRNRRYRLLIHDYSYIGFLIMFIFYAGTFAQDSLQAYEKEIRELGRKIKAVDDNISQTKVTISEDLKSYSAYQKQFDTYYGQQQAESDSLQKDYHGLHQQTDSLARVIQEVKVKQRELDLVQEQFHKILQGACAELAVILGKMAPGVVTNQVQALQFLQSELSVKAVDNVEALERLWQIMIALTDGTEAIEIYSGTSPIPTISGQVDFIRLGYAYCAIVNEKATTGAIWIPNASDSLGGSWLLNENPEHLNALKKCIKIRQGNAVPEIVSIPFDHPIVDDSQKTGGAQ